MKEKLTSKYAIFIYAIAIMAIAFWGYGIFKNKYYLSSKQEQSSSPSVIENPNIDNEAATQDDVTIETPNDTSTSNADSSTLITDENSLPITLKKPTTGNILANITDEHCSTGCQAFAIDLTLLKYCEQVCGISPIKKVSDCDGKKDLHQSLASDGLQQDYCNKDLAITKKDASICNKIKDDNVRRACEDRIEQDTLENFQINNPRTEPAS